MRMPMAVNGAELGIGSGFVNLAVDQHIEATFMYESAQRSAAAKFAWRMVS